MFDQEECRPSSFARKDASIIFRNDGGLEVIVPSEGEVTEAVKLAVSIAALLYEKDPVLHELIESKFEAIKEMTEPETIH